MERARFIVSPGFITFSSDLPGSFATLFGPRGTLSFASDASTFDDSKRAYEWAFILDGVLADGDEYVFATADRAVVGEVVAGRIQVSNRRVGMRRGSAGNPLRVIVPVVIPPTIHARSFVDPKVSVVTVTHNRVDMLRECMDSIVDQTERSWEHLIADDGSSDSRVREMLLDAAAADPRVRPFFRPHVDQPARWWNDLVDRSRGRYICFLDDDNLKLPRFMETMSAPLDADPSIDMVTCGWTVRNIDSVIDYHDNLRADDEIETRNMIDTGAFLIRREALERIGYFPLTIRTNEDWAIARRAVACLNIVHLGECLEIYRTHMDQRMRRCEALGNSRDKEHILHSVWGSDYGIHLTGPVPDELTSSQRDVLVAFEQGLRAIPWGSDGSDLDIVAMPFRVPMDDIRDIAKHARSMLLFCCEDPYAIFENLERAKVASSLCKDVWVSTCDTACVPDYQSVLGEHVIACPSLSMDHRSVTSELEKVLDVVVVGYGYPSRIQFIRALKAVVRDQHDITVIGDGWDSDIGAIPTMSSFTTLPLYHRARAVVCLHRKDKDCGPSCRPQALVARGYVEGCGGARVFIDSVRQDHPFDDGEVEWFNDPNDLAAKLTTYLSLPDDEQRALAEPLRLRTWRDFTYRTRVARIINCVRSPRYEAVIP